MSVSELIARQLAAARTPLDKGRTQEAIHHLEAMEAESRAYNRYENAILHQTRGYAYASADKYAKAADAFKEALSFKAMPDEIILAVMQNLRQPYIATEQYDRGSQYWSNGWPARARRRSHRSCGSCRQRLFSPEGLFQGGGTGAPGHQGCQTGQPILYQLLAAIISKRGSSGKWRRRCSGPSPLIPTRRNSGTAGRAYRQDHDDKRAARSRPWLPPRPVRRRGQGRPGASESVSGRAVEVRRGNAGRPQGRRARRGREPRILLAESWQQARELDNAARAYREAVKRAKDDGSASYRLGQLKYSRKNGRPPPMPSPGRSPGTPSEPGRARLLLGISQWYLGHPRQAAEALVAAQHDPKVKAEARRWLAQIRRSPVRTTGPQGNQQGRDDRPQGTPAPCNEWRLTSG